MPERFCIDCNVHCTRVRHPTMTLWRLNSNPASIRHMSAERLSQLTASAYRLAGRLVFNGTFSTNRLYRAIGVWNTLCRAGGQDNQTIKQWNNILNWKLINALWLCGDNLLTMKRCLQSLSSQSLGKYWQLNQTDWETEHKQVQTNDTQKVAQTNSKIHSKNLH